jgi:hypothetical protein
MAAIAEHFQVDPIKKPTHALPDGVALEAFVRTCGDTVGVISVMVTGGFALFRNGSCCGIFATLQDVFDELERVKA